MPRNTESDSTLSLRLPPETKRKVESIARLTDQSKTAIIQLAVDMVIERYSSPECIDEIFDKYQRNIDIQAASYRQILLGSNALPIESSPQ